jgi:hypoxanthine phosphoribosyltransferase
MVGVLRGAYMFLTDLARHIQMPLTIDFLGVSSYGPRKTSSGVVRLTSDLSCSVVGRDVLIVEDIIDTGLTMNYLKDNFCTRKPNSVRVCSLLKKPDCIIQPIHIDYLGFEIEDRFVIGYGLDYKEKYRNLPYIGVVEGIEDDD